MDFLPVKSKAVVSAILVLVLTISSANLFGSFLVWILFYSLILLGILYGPTYYKRYQEKEAAIAQQIRDENERKRLEYEDELRINRQKILDEQRIQEQIRLENARNNTRTKLINILKMRARSLRVSEIIRMLDDDLK